MAVTLPFAVVPTPFTVFNSSEIASRPASHLAEFDSIGMIWRSEAGDNNHFVYGDFGSAQEIDFVSLVHANAVSGTTWRFLLGNASSLASPTYSTAYGPFINPSITRADGLYSSHHEFTAASGRYFLFQVTNSGPFEAAKLIIGKKVTPATFYTPGWGQGVEDMGDVDVGRYGIADETPGRILRSLQMRLGWLSESDFETKFRALVEKLGKRRPALWCLDPTANAYRQARTYYGWLRNRPVTLHTANTPDGPRFEQEFDILSMI